MTDLRTLDEAARRLSVSRRTIERLIADRQLRVVKIGRASRVSEDELVRYVRTRERLA